MQSSLIGREADASAVTHVAIFRFLSLLLLAFMATASAMDEDSSHVPAAKDLTAASVSLGALLDSKGYLDLPKGYSAAVDVSGFEMLTLPDGTPRFQSVEQRGQPFNADQRWAEQLWLGGGCDGVVRAIVTGNSGEIYVGGEFTRCGGVAANRIIRFDPATDSWSALGSNGGNGLNDTVRVILVLGNELYVGGHFDQANVGEPIDAYGIAHWDGSNWSTVGSNGGQGVGNSSGSPTHVLSLAFSAGSLYVGGFFAQVNLGNGLPANNIARWDGSNWSAMGSGGGNGVDNAVNALAFFNGDLYVGGSFVNANIGAPVSVRRLARWDGSNWSAVGSGGGYGVDGQYVSALIVYNGELYIGGQFEQANVDDGIVANRIVRWNGSAWSVVGSGAGNGLSGTAWSMAISQGRLYVAGSFVHANHGANVNSRGVAAWDGSNWSALEGVGGSGVSLHAYAVAAIDGIVYVGGSFNQANFGNPIPVDHIARWHSGGWSALESGAQDTVRAMAVHNGNVYIAGDFTEIETASGPIAANRIARWDGSAWSELGSAGGNGLSGPVLALAVSGNDVYAAGLFDVANLGNDITANGVARWDGTQWHPLGSNGGNGIQGWLFALAARNNELYVGGLFSQVNAGNPISANHVALWNGNSWEALGSGGGNGLNSAVATLALDGNTLYVGGAFTEANAGNPVSANRIASWNGSNWQGLGSAGGNGVDDDVLAIAVSDGQVYMAGEFTQANLGASITANHVARWNGTSWSSLGTAGGNGVDAVARALIIDGDDVYVGGDFLNANAGNAVGAAHLARWDGNQWTPLGSGTNDIVRSLFSADGQTLYAAGDFTTAGTRAARRLASYRTRGDLAVLLSGIGSGEVESSPSAIDCPGNCSALLSWDREITLAATADPGWLFVGWTGPHCSGTSPCTLLFEQDSTIYAHFAGEGVFHDRFEPE